MGSAPRRYRPAHFRQVTRRDPALDLLRVIALARVVLWYLRAYFWMVLLAPVLARLARRLVVALPLFGVAIAVLEAAGRHHLPVVGAGSVRVVVGDAVTYGLFVVLGMAYSRRRRTIRG